MRGAYVSVVDCARRLCNHRHAVLQQDVVYPVMSQRAMTFVGGGARNFTEWFAFLGLVKVCAAPSVHLSGSHWEVQGTGFIK
jgi:hypothetical protein